MSYFNVTILGCGSATPTLRHNPSSQLVRYYKHSMLVDCGEGTQLQLRRYGASFAQIDHIFLSHLHGDHFLGLPGLLSTMSLHSVESAVTVHTFPEGVEMVSYLMNMLCRDRTFDLRFNVIDPERTQTVFEDAKLRVTSFPLYHRVPAVGFRFDEINKLRHINREIVDFYKVPNYMLPRLKEGMDLILPDGTVVPNERLTTAPSPAASYAYCSDTAFNPAVAESVQNIGTLYHEATYADDRDRFAAPRGHSTARQAGQIARMAGADTLVLGHFSKTVKDEQILVEQAAEEFNGKVLAANEGLVLNLA